VGAVFTMPLEVVKTRLQSSKVCFNTAQMPQSSLQNQLSTSEKQKFKYFNDVPKLNNDILHNGSALPRQINPTLIQCFKQVWRTEGPTAFFKGLSPTVMGVFPTRAVYFAAYEYSKLHLPPLLVPFNVEHIHTTHLLSSGFAGILAHTITNPIWMIKTRLQLDHKKSKKSRLKTTFKKIKEELGIRGFWKGVTASYMGVFETAAYFVLYEHFKDQATKSHEERKGLYKGFTFIEQGLCGMVAKSIVFPIFYPLEVVRTRTREPGSVYKGFLGTCMKVYKEEKGRRIRVFYGGFLIGIPKQLLNTFFIFMSYEFFADFLTSWTPQQEGGREL